MIYLSISLYLHVFVYQRDEAKKIFNDRAAHHAEIETTVEQTEKIMIKSWMVRSYLAGYELLSYAFGIPEATPDFSEGTSSIRIPRHLLVADPERDEAEEGGDGTMILRMLKIRLQLCLRGTRTRTSFYVMLYRS